MTARIGVIGCGWWATRAHLPALRANPDAVIAGIADPDPANRQRADGKGTDGQRADRHGASRQGDRRRSGECLGPESWVAWSRFAGSLAGHDKF